MMVPPEGSTPSALDIIGPLRANSGSFFDERSQPVERVVPLARDAVEISTGVLEAPGLQLPDALPAASVARALHEARSSERMKVLGDGLTRDGGVAAQAHDRERPFAAQPRDEPQARLVSECRKDRRGACEAGSRGARAGRHAARWS